MSFSVKLKNSWVAIFCISSVWHVWWWNLITSVCLIQVGNNRNDHFKYFLRVRVRLIKVSFKVNKGNKFGDFGYCPLNTGFTVLCVALQYLNAWNRLEPAYLAWENSHHSSLVALNYRNLTRRDVCDSAAEILYWWHKNCPEFGQEL